MPEELKHMKFVEDRPYRDPEVTARKLMEIAKAVKPVQDGRLHIEKINWPMLTEFGAAPAEYKARSRLRHRAGLALAARERHLREDHRHRCGAFQLTARC